MSGPRASVVAQMRAEAQRQRWPDDITTMDRYLSWGADNDAGDPGAAQNLLRWLHSQYPSLAWSTARGYAWAVAAECRHRGLTNPVDERVRRYLGVLKRDLGAVKQHHKIDEITADDLRVIAPLARAARPEDARLQAVVVVGLATRLRTTGNDGQVQGLRASAFRETAEQIVITTSLGRALIDRHRDRVGYQVVRDVLATNASVDLPLAGPGDLKTSTIRDGNRLRSTFNNAFPNRSRSGLETQLHDLDQADRNWLLLRLSPQAWRRRRELACLLVGFVGARRAADLGVLRTQDLETTPGGYRYATLDDKGNRLAARQGGEQRPLVGYVDHLEDEPGTCPAHCPACALDEWLAIRPRIDPDPDGWLFPWSSPDIPVTAASLTEAIRGLWALHPDPRVDVRLGSRSMRVGAYTEGSALGLSLPQMMEMFGVHRSMEKARLYLRSDGAPEPIVLPIRVPRTSPLQT